ncbi:MAG: helix-turn-helix domain-containing protein [Rhodospirillaceae bacterium]
MSTKLRHVLIPVEWIDDGAITADMLAVLVTLKRHADFTTGEAFPSQATIASKLGRSRPWVNRVIAELVEQGLVTKERRHLARGGETSCKYHLVSSISDTPCQPVDTNRTHNQQTQDASKSPVQISNVPAEDWQPTDKSLARALERFPNVDLAASIENFVLRCRAKNYRYRDVDAAWLSWLAEDTLKPPHRASARGAQKVNAAENRYAAWAGVARRAA